MLGAVKLSRLNFVLYKNVCWSFLRHYHLFMWNDHITESLPCINHHKLLKNNL